MLSELPKLFGKGFLIGYFFPTVIVVAVLARVLDLMGVTDNYTIIGAALFQADEKLLVVRFGIALAILWAIATLLFVFNFIFIQILEGYGAANPARLWAGVSLRRFDAITARLQTLVDRGNALSAAEKIERQQLRLRLTAEFPERRDLILPTRFGNIVRAFERYPQVVYGVEPISTWIRLQAGIPEHYRGFLDDAKALLDFFINLWAGASFVALFAFCGLIYGFIADGVSPDARCALTLITAASVVAALAFAKLAQGFAAQWGELVKAAYDLYRGELSKQLGLELPRSIEYERRMWGALGRTMIYRRPEDANQLTGFRRLPPDDE